MRLIDARIRNFGPFLDVTVKLDKLGLISVLGENQDAPLADNNGSGKSFILEALVWCFWGKTIRGLKDDEVISLVAKKDCEVTISLEDEGTTYTITRTRGMTGKKANDLVLHAEGKNASKRKAATQEQINLVLGMDFDTFCAMMPGAKVKVAEMTDSKVKELLENILQTQIYSEAYVAVRKRLSLIESDLLNLDRALVAQGQYLDSQRSKLKELEEKNQTFEDDRKKDIQIWLQLRNDAAKDIEVKKSVLTDRAVITLKLEAVTADLGQLQKQWTATNGDISKLHAQAAKVRDLVARNEAVTKQQLKDVNKQLSEMATMEACKHCRQPVTSEHRASLKEQLLQDQRVHAATLSQASAMFSAFETEFQAQLSTLTKRQEDLKSKIKDLEVKRDEYRRFLSFSVTEAEDSLNKLSLLLSNLDEQLHQAYVKQNPFESLINDLHFSVHKIEEDMADMTGKRDVALKDKARLEFWLQAFSPSGLRTFLLDNVTPYLSQRAQHYADVLTDGELSIKFHTRVTLKSGEMREKFYIDVNHTHGGASYTASSDGERRRAEIAIALALGDLASLRSKKKWPFRFMDEPFENLDESGIQAVVKLLQEQAKAYDTLMVVTHNDQLKSMFPKELRVVKKDGVSTIHG